MTVSPDDAAAPRADLTRDEEDFVDSIRMFRATGEAAEATLRTDDRVLARITDGIYRQTVRSTLRSASSHRVPKR